MSSSTPSRPSILITGGGTAGHVEPALAVARALVNRGEASECSLSERGGAWRRPSYLEAGFAVRLLPGRGLVARISLSNVGSLLRLLVRVREGACHRLADKTRRRRDGRGIRGTRLFARCDRASSAYRRRQRRCWCRSSESPRWAFREGECGWRYCGGCRGRWSRTGANRGTRGEAFRHERRPRRDILDIPTEAPRGGCRRRIPRRRHLECCCAVFAERELSDLDDVFIYHVCGERNEASLRSELST